MNALDSDDFEDKRLKWANETAGSLPGEHCPECNDRGYIFERRNGELVSVDCKCMEKRRSLERIKRSGLADLLDKYTFQAYRTPERWQKEAKQKAINFLNDHGGKWFIASGNPGSGKTHLCTAICGELMASGMGCRYFLWRDDGARIKAAVTDSEEYSRLIGPLKRAKVLYIDDFWKSPHGKITDGDINLAFELLNTRYNQRGMVTIISTELSLEQILDIDEAIGSRLYERSKGYYVRINGAGKNWRLK